MVNRYIGTDNKTRLIKQQSNNVQIVWNVILKTGNVKISN